MSSAVLFFLIASIVSYKVFKNIVHPVVVFNIIWLIVLATSSYIVEDLGYYKPSLKIYNIFLLGGVCFNVGAILLKVLLPHKRSIKSTKRFTSISKKKTKVFLFAEIILAIYYSIKSIYILKLLLSGQTYDAIRDMYFSDEMQTSPIEILFILFIFDPLLIITEILLPINLFNNIFPKKFNYIMLLNLLLRSFFTAGRTAVFETGCLILVAAIYFGAFKGANKRKLFGFITGMFALFYSMALISSQRRGGEFGIIEIAFINLTSYFTGSFPFFEDLLNSKDYLPPTYGIVTFGGFFDIVIHFLRIFHLTNMPLTYISVGSILAEFRPIGDNLSYNAMPTMYYYFFTDFRETGFIIFPFLFGCVSIIVYRKLKHSGTLLSYVYYSFLMLLIIESSFNWQLSRIPFILAILYVYLYLNKKEPIKNKSLK